MNCFRSFNNGTTQRVWHGGGKTTGKLCDEEENFETICLLQEPDEAANKAAGFAGMQQTLLRQATISEEDQVGGTAVYEG